jgi:hypothetical protein
MCFEATVATFVEFCCVEASFATARAGMCGPPPRLQCLVRVPRARVQAAVTAMLGFLIIVDFMFMSPGAGFVYDPDYKVR